MPALRLIVAVVAALASIPAAAQTERNPLAEREGRLPNVLSWMQTQGVHLTFLGEEGGLRGYLAEAASGKMQTFYVTPDGNHAIAGILFKTGGDNVTGVQIGEMRQRFESAVKGLENATVADAPSVTDPAAPTSSDGVEPSNESANRVAPAADPEGASATPDRPAAVTTVPSASTVQAPRAIPDADPLIGSVARSALPVVPPPGEKVEGALGNPADLWIGKLDQDKTQFLAAAEAAPFFEVGSVSAKPLLYMVADPQCPYCHKAWETLRTLVYEKRLRVRVILIAGLAGSEPIAREILSRPTPARIWLDSDAGTRKIEATTDPSSPAWTAAGRYLQANMDFARSFKIDKTPFLAYVGENGSLYSALGLPTDLDGFLSASGAL